MSIIDLICEKELQKCMEVFSMGIPKFGEIGYLQTESKKDVAVAAKFVYRFDGHQIIDCGFIALDGCKYKIQDCKKWIPIDESVLRAIYHFKRAKQHRLERRK